MLGLGSLFGGDGGGGGRGGFLGGLLGPRFSCELKCYPVSFAGREDLEAGNRLILPPVALQKLQDAGAPSPLLFEISDLDGRRRTHGGVMEFTAPEETCYIPYWILQQLQVQEGDVLRVTLKQLPKATFARFRPASVALHRVYNPRALLECGLRGFVALTEGDCFAVEYNGKKYGIEVVELKPSEAACIIDTDVQVEFATPKEAEAAAATAASRAPSRHSDGSSDAGDPGPGSPARSRSRSEEPRTKLFTGAGRRIDGAPVCPGGDMQQDDSEEDGRRLRWTSPSRGPATFRDACSVDDMPWKRRIPSGVKWTEAPFGVDLSKLHGQDNRDELGPSTAAAASSLPPPPVSGPSPSASTAASTLAAAQPGVDQEARARRLEAAEARYAQNAEQIERKRKEEEEEKARQRVREEEERHARIMEEEQKRRRAADLALSVQQAPAQQQMMAGKGNKSARGASTRKFCWCCFFGGSSKSHEASPSRV